VVNNNMPTNTAMAAASDKNTVRITRSGRTFIVMISPNDVPEAFTYWSAANFGASNA
jgi:hypothetical protein